MRALNQPPQADTGDALSDEVSELLSSDSTMPNLLVTGRNVPDLDLTLAQGIERSLLAYNDGEIDLLPGLPALWENGFRQRSDRRRRLRRRYHLVRRKTRNDNNT